jgi:hypothetical protein
MKEDIKRPDKESLPEAPESPEDAEEAALSRRAFFKRTYSSAVTGLLFGVAAVSTIGGCYEDYYDYYSNYYSDYYGDYYSDSYTYSDYYVYYSNYYAFTT